MVRDNNNDSSGRDKGGSNYRGPARSGATKPSAIEYKFTLQTDGKTQATFSNVQERIVLLIQQTYEQGVAVAESLRNLTIAVTTPPTMREAVEGAADAVLARQAVVDLEDYKTDSAMYKARIELFNSNMAKAFALIYGTYCGTTMRNRVDEMMNTDATIRNDPIKLLTTIRGLMQEPILEQDPMWSLIKSIIKSLSITQHESENLSDYTKRFKQNRDFMKGLLGDSWLDNWVERQPEYVELAGNDDQAALEAAMKACTFARMNASLMIHGASTAKYGSLVMGLDTQLSLGNDQWPKTTDAAAKFLSKHKLDSKWRDKDTTARVASFAQRAPRDLTNVTCYCCGKKGHLSPDCDDVLTRAPDKWFKPKEKKVLNQTADDESANEQSESEPEPSSEEEARPPRRKSSSKSKKTRTRRGGTRSGGTKSLDDDDDDGWAALQFKSNGTRCSANLGAVVLKQRSKWSSLLEDTIILDTGSTISGTVMNPNFVTNVKSADKPITMSTNAGSKRLTMTGTVPGFGPVYFDPEQMANIFGFGHMVEKYRITYDSSVEDSFHVHMGDRIVKFHRTPEGLYAYRPDRKFIDRVARDKNLTPPPPDIKKKAGNFRDDSYPSLAQCYSDDEDNSMTSCDSVNGPSKRSKKSHELAPITWTRDCASMLVSTVKENLAGFTKLQHDRARVARAFYHSVGCPTLTNLKLIIRQNIIKNCPVTVEDVDVAELIFGPDLGTLKGKSTRRKPVPVRDDNIAIPPELTMQHKNLVLCMDLMFICGLPMFTCIDRSIKYRSVVPLKNRRSKELYRALDVVFRVYNAAGFTITEIHCDQEFKHQMDLIYDNLDITMNYTTTGDHVPEAERNNRTLKERIRAAFHNLPFHAMPGAMLKQLVLMCCHQLNIFPSKTGISDYFSPYSIMSGRNIDYSRLSIPFGSYVQASHEAIDYNTLQPRTIGCIHLGQVPSKQGGHRLLHLSTGGTLTRPRATVVPMSDDVISRVEALAAAEGIKSLKLADRNGNIFDPIGLEGVRDAADNDDDEDAIEDLDDDDDSDDEDDEDDDDDLDDEVYDPIDRAELDGLTDDLRLPAHANDSDDEDDSLDDTEEAKSGDNSLPQDINDESDSDEEEDIPIPAGKQQTATRASVRTITKPSRLGFDQEDKRAHDFVKSTRKQLLNRIDYSFDESLKDRGSKECTVMDGSSKECDTEAFKPKVRFQGVPWEKIEQCHSIVGNDKRVLKHIKETLYSAATAKVMARCIIEIREGAINHGASFAQNHILQKGLKLFGQAGTDAAAKELDQLHSRYCFRPRDVSTMTAEEQTKALQALMFLTEKRDKSIKGRMVANGKPSREWLTRGDSASPTAALESILLTTAVDSKEGRDVMSADVPNAFIQTPMPPTKPGEARVMLKITGVLVDLLVKLAPEVYGPYVVFERNRKVLYCEVLRALYGMLMAALLWYKQFKRDLETIGFEFNPYDPCVCNRKVNGKQHTVRFHVDDLMSSHMDPVVNDQFLEWLNRKYGGHGAVKATRGHIHDYLGMTFDFSQTGKVIIDMRDYVANMLTDCLMNLGPKDTSPTPASEDLFDIGDDDPLDKTQAELFHTIVAKGLFLCKRARPDVHLTIAFLCTRVRNPTLVDWRKLERMMSFLNGTKEDVLTLSVDDLHVIKWHVDASFAVHPDFRSHTGGVMTFGRGAIQTISRKQRLNTRSSTEAELVGADDAATKILWTKLFMEKQGYGITSNILFQDNQSAILLETNGQKSSSKRTRALNIRYFFLADQVAKGNLDILYLPTDAMWGDYMTKPLQGKLFQRFRKAIMGMEP